MISWLATMVLGAGLIKSDIVETPQIPIAPKVLISKIQTGYGSDGRQEFVEIYNNDGQIVSLDGWKLEYKNGATERTLYEFGEVKLRAGGTFLLAYEYRVASTNTLYSYYKEARDDIFKDNYSGTSGSLASTGVVTLTDYSGEKPVVINQVDYGAVDKEKFPTIGRCLDAEGIMRSTDNANADFVKYEKDIVRNYYECVVDEEDDETGGGVTINRCASFKINEVSLYEGEAFVELINETDKVAELDGCVFHRGSIEIALSGSVESGALISFAVPNTTNLKQMNSTIDIWLYDLKFTKEKMSLVNYMTVKSGMSLAWFDEEEQSGWLKTYEVTPGLENRYKRYPDCEAGKIINPETENCIKAPVVAAECPVGSYRNPETGRCKKLTTTTALAACPEGSFRNPETNRCKKLATETVLASCQAGYERNPETNRCRKIVDSTSSTFAVQNVPSSEETNIMIGIAAGGIGVTLAMIIWQFRQEIGRGFARMFTRKVAK